MERVTKVLVVDDKSENLVAMEAILSDLDIEVVTAGSGNEALSIMVNQEFALVLLDVQMPGMDGFETAELMSGSSRTKNTPIIFLTALSKEEEYIQRGYSSGAVDYILKPISPDIIRHKVTIFKKLYEQNSLIKSQAIMLKSINQQLQGMYEVEFQARKAKDSLLMEQSKLATLGEMIGYMAHQWKQPLSILHLCFQSIEDIMVQESMFSEELDTSIDNGMNQLEYMAQTIDDFKNYLKPDKQDAKFNASAAVLDVLKLLGGYVTRRGLNVKYICEISGSRGQDEKVIMTNVTNYCGEKTFRCDKCPGRVAWVAGSQNEFKQILINLINNARDAIEMREGNGSWLADDEITIISNIDGDDFVVSVCDTAGGVPEDIQDRIFDPYFTTKETKGTGLGLSMVKSMLEDHFSGSLKFFNKERGACFTFTVKLAD